MNLTIAFFTNRRDPKFEWFFASLKREVKGDLAGITPILIDYHADDEGRKEETQELFRKFFPDASHLQLIHSTPKPTIWQGAHRLTKNNYFAASNARNTAFALCRDDFIACIDDLSAMVTGWLPNVRHAQQHRYVALGAYKKVMQMSVDDSGIINFEAFPPGVDSRFARGTSEGIMRVTGDWLFGCSFALPIDFALRVNGFDEICDGQGAEDYDFGIRLQRAGCKLFYNRNMLTYESEELHSAPGNERFIRISKETDYKGGRMMSDHVLLNRVRREDRSWTISDRYTLRDLRSQVLGGAGFPIPTEPTTDWRDGKPLNEM